jgi:hypothetical protein
MIKLRCKVPKIEAAEPGSAKWRCRTRQRSLLGVQRSADGGSAWQIIKEERELGREVVKSEEVIAALSESPARALAYAAQLVRSRPQWKHPYYWAAFQANGLAHYTNYYTSTPKCTPGRRRTSRAQIAYSMGLCTSVDFDERIG